jgi:Na+/proline symporter
MIKAVLIIAVYVFILMLVIRLYRRGRSPGDKNSLTQFILAGKNVSSVFLTPSVFTQWVWVTTIIGAAEAGILYGVSGIIAYNLGAVIAFIILILLISKLYKLVPDGIFINDFIKDRFSGNAKILFDALSVGIVIYMQIEMAAGLGFVYNGLFGMPFQAVVIVSVGISVAFIVLVGTRGMLMSEALSFVVIEALFLVTVFTVIGKFDLAFLYERLGESSAQAAATEPMNYLAFYTEGGFKYFIAAIFIALAQITIEPGYYLKAKIAKSRKDFTRSFVIGGVFLFIPIGALSGVVFGLTALALDFDLHSVDNSSVMISSKMILEHFGAPLQIVVGALVLVIAISKLISTSAGLMSVASIDIYDNITSGAVSERDRISFGKIFTVVIGSISGLLAISLEKISLLTIDIFCGIMFSAAFSVIIVGFFSRKKLGNFAIFATVLGAAAGFITWVFMFGDESNWFYGVLMSFAVPIVFLGVVSLFIRDRFNFRSFNRYD